MNSQPRTPGLEQTTLVCFALKEEASPFERITAGRSCPSLLITGIGRQNAEASVRSVLAHPLGGTPPRLVLTCGFAGGLDPALTLGDVVFATAEPTLAQRLTASGAKAGRFLCTERIATTAAEKQKLRAETGADVVEMESEVIHALCRERGIPCATVRVISDTAHEDLPLDFNRLAKPDLSLDYTKLAWAIVRSPCRLPALLRLQKNSKLAAERLAVVLAQVL